MMKLSSLALSVLLAIGAAESVVRLGMHVDESPVLAWDAEHRLLIHRPQQTGTRYPNGSTAVHFSINAQGWNAPGDYVRDYRTHFAAVIGDSFVEALQVAPNQSVSSKLQEALGSTWSVAGFGISGAPLSQYLAMAQMVIDVYHPDVIVVVLVHNDFLESYDPPAAAFYQSFWQVDQTDNCAPAPCIYYRNSLRPPHAYTPPRWAPIAEHSAVARLSRRTLLALAPHSDRDRSMGVDVAQVQRQHASTDRVTDFLFQQFETLKPVAPIVFAMDAPRDVIETMSDTHPIPASAVYDAINVPAQRLAAAHGFRLHDLTADFQADWLAHHQRFGFADDYHWNAYTHALVARTLVPLVVRQ